MAFRTRLIAVILTLAASVGCDQQTKSLAWQRLHDRDTVCYLNNVVRFDYVENSGAFLSLGSTLPAHWRTTLFVLLAGAGIAAGLWYALRGSRLGLSEVIALSLICGGGIGNLLDRVFRDGQVRDFVSIGIGPLRTGIFNVADVALMAGFLMFLVVGRAGRPGRPGRKTSTPDSPASRSRPGAAR